MKELNITGGVLNIQSGVEEILSSTLIKENSIIKSYQKGHQSIIYAGHLGDSSDIYDIPISTIDPTRCIFIWDYSGKVGLADYSSFDIYLTQNSIRVVNTSQDGYYSGLKDLHWQVIEFY